MNGITKILLATLFVFAITSANASVVQVWQCTVNEGTSDADIEKASSAWLAAAKSVNSGENFEVYHTYPLAANAGVGGFQFILIAPDAAAWGAFNAAYAESAADKADDEWGKFASCSGSSLWNSKEIK